MIADLFHLAYLGPGGPEFLVIMLVLLVMFGAKDAPRILRKLNEIISQIRNTADSFKREVMYGDLNNDTPSSEPSENDGESGHDEDYDYDNEEDYYNYGEDDGGDGEAFEEIVDAVAEDGSPAAEPGQESTPVVEPDPEVPEDEDGDAPKT